MKENKVLAVIDGREITDEDLDAFLSDAPKEHRNYINNQRYRDANLEPLIAIHLFAKLGEEMKLEEREDLKKIFESAKLDLLARLAVAELYKSVTVTEEEIKAYYQAHGEEFAEPETIRASHILVSSEEQCADILKMIHEGEKTFEECAQEFSTCPSGQKGGDLGEFGRGDMVPEFEEPAFDAEVGVVFGPIKTQFGYHAIRVDEKNEPYVYPLEDVEDEVLEKVTKVKGESVYAEKYMELKDKYLQR